jgi:hypothetical protein
MVCLSPSVKTFNWIGLTFFLPPSDIMSDPEQDGFQPSLGEKLGSKQGEDSGRFNQLAHFNILVRLMSQVGIAWSTYNHGNIERWHQDRRVGRVRNASRLWTLTGHSTDDIEKPLQNGFFW